MDDDAPVIELRRLGTRFGRHVVHEGLDLAVRRGEVLGLAGGSGSGKSVLLREMILLQRPTSGEVRVFDQPTATLDAAGIAALRRRWGVMFQRGGLFSALTVRANVGLPLREYSGLDETTIDETAEWKLALTGLPADAGLKRPGELSGACSSAPRWRVPSPSTPSCCSSTSPPRGSTRPAPTAWTG